MNILWVKAGKLLPVDTGGRIRTYNLLIHLAKIHNLTFHSYYGGQRDLEYERQLTALIPGAIAQSVPSMDRSGWRGAVDYLRALPSRHPYAVKKFSSSKVRQTVAAHLAANKYDLAVCDFLAPSLNFPKSPNLPTILFEHNVEAEIWSRLAEVERKPLLRIAYAIEAWKMQTYEKETVRRFDHVWTVSERDLKQLSAFTGAERLSVVETGVDARKFSSNPGALLDPNLVIFTGSMDWEPNIDCAEYFCQEIWPDIKRQAPEARFRIVGRNPHPRVKRLVSDSIEVTGSVPSILDHLYAASVVVVPLRAGGGTRLKIYECMAAAKPIVSTSIGAEGLDITNGKDILLADNASAFSSTVVALLKDAELRQRIGDAARHLAEKYDWSKVAARCGDLMASVARRNQPLVGSASGSKS